MTITKEQLDADLERLHEDINDCLHPFVHGDEQTEVSLGGQNTPSLRNMVQTVKAAQNDIKDEIIEDAGKLADDAAKKAADNVESLLEEYKDSAANSAGRAEDAAERAEAAAGGAEGTPLASQAEVNAGEEAGKAVAPKTLRGRLGYQVITSVMSFNALTLPGSYLVTSGASTGQPDGSVFPLFLDVSESADGAALTQFIYERDGQNRVWFRAAAVSDGVPAWGAWKEVTAGGSDGAGGGFNTLEIKTAGGAFTAPVDGWYKVTCIGGGGGGGKGGYDSLGGLGGSQGGTTAFGSLLSAVGGPGGGGAGCRCGGGGGGAGRITEGYVFLTKGQTISITIGAGGLGALSAAGSLVGGDGAGPNAGRGGYAYTPATGALGAEGGSAGSSSNAGGNIYAGRGGNGGDNGTEHGGGGGGGGGRGNASSYYGLGGRGGPNAISGADSTSSAGGNGGDGGPGAVILEYFDPGKAA